MHCLLTTCFYHRTHLFGTLQCPVSSLNAFNRSNISSHRSCNVEPVSAAPGEGELLRRFGGLWLLLLPDGDNNDGSNPLLIALGRRRSTPFTSSFSDAASMTIEEVKCVLFRILLKPLSFVVVLGMQFLLVLLPCPVRLCTRSNRESPTLCFLYPTTKATVVGLVIFTSRVLLSTPRASLSRVPMIFIVAEDDHIVAGRVARAIRYIYYRCRTLF